MEEEEDGNTTPFWIQKNSTNSISSIFFSSGLVVFLLLVIALLFLIFIVPSNLSFKSNNVKKSWDSLNMVLVLAALLFGFLSKITNKNNHNDEFQSLSPPHKSKPDQWYDSATIEEDKPEASGTNSDKLYYEYQDEGKSSILRRNVSSYPDLREFSYNRWNDQRTFIEDFHVGRVSERVNVHRRHRSVEEVDLIAQSQMKTVFFDTLNERSARKLNTDLESIKSVKPPSAPTSDQKQVQSGLQEDLKRVNENAGSSKARSRGKLNKDVESKSITIPLRQSPPEKNISKSDRKRGTATKDLLNSLYHQKKKKKPRQKSMENLDNYLVHQPQDPPTFQLPLIMPAPAPQQPSMVISTKKQKTKKIISVVVTPHPSSATQPPPNRNSETAPLPDLQREIKMKSFEKFDENSNSGGESPLNPIPPPPPPPPPAFFKNTAWKFVVQGDYVRINSSNSSRSESSDIDDVDSDATPTAAEGHGITMIHPPLFCPSPDVDTKADSFITSFRAKLKMEKVHSFNKRGLGLSGLGPRHGPNQN